MRIIILSLFVSNLVLGIAKLQVPLLFEDCVKKNGKMVCTTRFLSSLNDQLKELGVTSSLYDEFPDYVQIEAESDISEEYQGIEELLEAANKALKQDIELSRYNSVSQYTNSKLAKPLCYVGLKSTDSKKRWAHAQEVVGFMRNLSDSVFSDQLQILGWKYKNNKELREDMTPEDETAFPQLWREWRGTGEAILVVNVDDDDGNNCKADIVKRCN